VVDAEMNAEPGPATPVFRVARNPDPRSRFGYLLSLPVAGEAPLYLACAQDWPGATDAYCRPVAEWPADAELVAQVPVERCRRSGNSVQLVLRRGQRRRALFVWVSGPRGRAIFWRTQKTMAAARPGIKVPAARGLDRPLEVAVDQRERYAWKFARHPADLSRRLLPAGDYGVFAGDELVAVVERKSPDNLAGDAVGGNLGLALADLEQLPYACLVVEGRLSDVLRAVGPHVQPAWLMSVLAALQVVHPRVPWVFAETRALAEDYSFRWLGAALRQWRERRSGVARRASDQLPPRQLALLEAGAPYAVHDRAGRQAEAARLARQGKVWTSAAFAERFGVSRATARDDLSQLVAAGQLAALGGRRTRRYVAVAEDGAGTSP
jgi:hypothetical protein